MCGEPSETTCRTRPTQRVAALGRLVARPSAPPARPSSGPTSAISLHLHRPGRHQLLEQVGERPARSPRCGGRCCSALDRRQLRARARSRVPYLLSAGAEPQASSVSIRPWRNTTSRVAGKRGERRLARDRRPPRARHRLVQVAALPLQRVADQAVQRAQRRGAARRARQRGGRRRARRRPSPASAARPDQRGARRARSRRPRSRSRRAAAGRAGPGAAGAEGPRGHRAMDALNPARGSAELPEAEPGELAQLVARAHPLIEPHGDLGLQPPWTTARAAR